MEVVCGCVGRARAAAATTGNNWRSRTSLLSTLPSTDRAEQADNPLLYIGGGCMWCGAVCGDGERMPTGDVDEVMPKGITSMRASGGITFLEMVCGLFCGVCVWCVCGVLCVLCLRVLLRVLHVLHVLGVALVLQMLLSFHALYVLWCKMVCVVCLPVACAFVCVDAFCAERAACAVLCVCCCVWCLWRDYPTWFMCCVYCVFSMCCMCHAYCL